MKKLYFIDESLDRMGGVERVISTLANKLIDKYDITLISVFRSNEKYYFNYNEKINKINIYNRYKFKSKKFKKSGLLYYFFRVIEKYDEKKSLSRDIKKYARLIEKNAIVIFGGVQTAIKFIPYINCKKIIVREAVHYYCYNDIQREVIDKYFVDKVDTIITSSDENIEIYNKIFNNRIRLIKIYNPLGITPILNNNLDSKSIVSVGRFDKQKGYDYLLYAFKKVNERHPDWKLRLIGDGYYKSQIEKIIKDNCLESCVTIEKPTKDVVYEINKSSIYVLSSRFEGYANSLVEAMACGIPSISYDWLVGVDDIIDDQENGIIVRLEDRFNHFNGKNANENDIKNLATAINRLIEDKKMRIKLNKNSPKIVESRNNEKIIEKWVEIIEGD